MAIVIHVELGFVGKRLYQGISELKKNVSDWLIITYYDIAYCVRKKGKESKLYYCNIAL